MASSSSSSFTITAPPGTDVWRKPPSTDVFNAPTIPHPTTETKTSPLTTFHSARVSFRLPQPLTQYDQAGLLFSLSRGANSTTTAAPSSPSPPKWLKSGVEFYNGAPRAATVACDAWADWSLSPVTPSSSPHDGGDDDDGWVTVAVENGRDELGKSLWVYQVVVAGGGGGGGGGEAREEKVPLREVCWPFGHGGEWELKVEAYACRPNKETKEELVVEFKGFEVKWV